MSCYCGDRYCPKCNPTVGGNIAKTVTVEPTKAVKKMTATQAINSVQKRLGRETAAIITREEYEALYQLVILAKGAKDNLEKSEKPFYDGMKLLNEVL